MSELPPQLPNGSEPVRQEDSDAISAQPTLLQSGMKKLIGTEISQTFAMMGQMGNPLHQKMSEQHITQMLTLSEKHDEREYNLAMKQQENEHAKGTSERWYHALYVLILAGVVVTIILVFHNQPQVLTPILTGIGGGVAGFMGGVGYNKTKKE